MKTIASNAGVEIALRQGKVRCDLGNRLMKSVIKARELRRRWEDRLRRSDERQCLRNVQRRKMDRSPQCIQDLWSDELMRTKIRSSVHHTMAHGHGRVMDMLWYGGCDNLKRMKLRFVNTLALYQRCSIRGTNVQAAIALSDTCLLYTSRCV